MAASLAHTGCVYAAFACGHARAVGQGILCKVFTFGVVCL